MFIFEMIHCYTDVNYLQNDLYTQTHSMKIPRIFVANEILVRAKVS